MRCLGRHPQDCDLRSAAPPAKESAELEGSGVLNNASNHQLARFLRLVQPETWPGRARAEERVPGADGIQVSASKTRGFTASWAWQEQ